MKQLLVMTLVLAGAGAARAGIKDTAHNLSASGRGPIKAVNESEICVFCHVPHPPEGRPALWSRPLREGLYRPYESSTLRGEVGQPDGASKLCLSCHDGTIALGLVQRGGRSRRIELLGAGAGGVMPAGPANFGTDLRHSHPVSMSTPSGSTRARKPTGPAIKLDRQHKVQCTSCHDPHKDDKDPLQRKFLVQSNSYSAVCLGCHRLRNWSASTAHQASPRLFPPEAGNHTPYRTVAETGCESCHKTHSAARGARNLKAEEEGTCLTCHAGQVSAMDVTADFAKPYAHPTLRNPAPVHDAAEGPHNAERLVPERSPSAPRHAECVDCHDPHAANDRKSKAPGATGALEGVWGIDRAGLAVEPVRYEYEVCFKCHADSANKPQSFGVAGRRTRRAEQELNLRLAFDPMGPSAHPVVAPGKNFNVPGLLGGLSVSSQIYCTDCHRSDSGSRAPHGSIYPFLLERQYATRDYTAESPSAYALCYGCHDRQVLLSPASVFPHRQHVVDASAPCSACHDAHGVGLAKGSARANAHLISFDRDIVRNVAKELSYESLGSGAGLCTLSCHGYQHLKSRYPRVGF